MARRPRGPLRQRLVHLFGVALVAFVFLLGGTTVATYGTVAYTSRSEFCNSCHIMDPYYASWESGSHSGVACIECHFEPGVVETFEGKFAALSQLAKYVTRTAGTKPWAEVSDSSCLRSGCHALPDLEHEIAFGDVRFDHKPHLLDSSRGGQLRCVSCHSQVYVDEHMSVPTSVCSSCHFMPGPDGERVEELSDCRTCHAAPEGPLLVAGRPFDHDGYVARGVACTECHVDVVRGAGAVGRQRCYSCHADLGLIERITETAFVHETHVTKHKVECFQCHDEIRHGLLAPEPVEHGGGMACNACHAEPHESARLLYAGQGAVGVEDAPSRMLATHVDCKACHTGRTAGLALRPGDGRDPHAGLGPAAAGIAAAGEADCIHCHGPGYDGMLAEWQAVVGGQLERLRPMLDALEPEVRAAADPARRELLDEARRNVALVAVDGSRGAHNPLYALDALRASAARIDELQALLQPEAEATALAGFPFRSEHGCSACHLAAERYEVEVHHRPFSHERHLAREAMDCATCHSVDVHGAPSFPRQDCASCHHQEREDLDVYECGSCHASQVGFRSGQILGFEGPADPMAEMECGDCHGEPPDLILPKPALCVLCHEPGYDEMMVQWQARTRELEASVVRALQAAGAGASGEARATARRALDAVRRDGSLGAHNAALAEQLLSQALEALGER